MEIIEWEDEAYIRKEFSALQYWINIKNFDRKSVNRRLKKYSQGDESWMYEGGVL